ncbi:tetrapyrrole (Corrin/Porphyrin) Methylase [Wolffia australiana]
MDSDKVSNDSNAKDSVRKSSNKSWKFLKLDYTHKGALKGNLNPSVLFNSIVSPAVEERKSAINAILASSSCFRLCYNSSHPRFLGQSSISRQWSFTPTRFLSWVFPSFNVRPVNELRRHAVCSASLSSISDSERELSLNDDLESSEVTIDSAPAQQGPLKSGLYLVATPIGNLEDITLRALRILKSVDVILAEDTRHSSKLLQHFCIKTPLVSFHKFNENRRESAVLSRLHQGQCVAMISDAGTPGISDPGMELVKSCIREGIPVTPIPGASALLTALSASGLSTDEFTFVGFLPKHAGTRRERLIASAKEKGTQVFFVPPHKIQQFLQEASLAFGESRNCVIAREMTKFHEEFWRGTFELANKAFSVNQPKGEITVLVEGVKTSQTEVPTESQLEDNLRHLMSGGHSLSEAVKLVAEGTASRRKQVYSIALKIYGKQASSEDL